LVNLDPISFLIKDKTDMRTSTNEGFRSKFDQARLKFWQLAETRAIFELQNFYQFRWLLRKLPKGDGHPVIVYPGFVASDVSTAPMRKLLEDLNYTTYGWGLGRNLIFDEMRKTQMRKMLNEVYNKHQQKVSLVGWSLGGVFARELAKHAPDKVRSVVTLGSPISGRSEDSNASDLFQSINGRPRSRGPQRLDLNRPPPVPTTSIYSKTDGVVHWRGSVQHRHANAVNQQVENIEVPASHIGLGVNSLVMVVLADRLAQAESKWQPFSFTGWRALLFRQPKGSVIVDH
jgi:esterase/lipase